MKKILIILALVTIAEVSAQAQYEIMRSGSDTSSRAGLHDVGWMHSHLLDNWFIDVNGGGQLYYGFEDRKGAFADRLTSKAEAHIGHWIFPSIGLRGGLGIANSHGFISLDSYKAYRGALTRDFGTCYGTSTDVTVIGQDTIRGAFGGYYWPVDGKDDILMQKWRYLYGGFDVMINLSFLKRMNRVKMDRRWNNIVYAGFNIRYGLTEKHPERVNNTNAANEGHIGYLGTWNVWRGLCLSADVRLSLMEGDFDRERIEGVEKMGPDMELSVLGGLSYNFHFRSNGTRRRYYVERGKIDYATQEVPRFIALIQKEEVEHILIADTILVYQKYEADSPEIAHYLDSLRDAVNRIPDDTPLDTILLNHLLPYEMVFFDLDKWDIRPNEELKIARMARVMKAYPNHIFHLYGSADAKTGTVKRNVFLSHNRADMVYNRLILEYGIPAKQLRRDYLGGILDYDPFILNRTTVIIMDHPAVQKAFEAMKQERKAGGNVVPVGRE